jgi:acyl-CoA thioesterase-1
MVFPLLKALPVAVTLMMPVVPALGQFAVVPPHDVPENASESLSPECRVPVSELYALAPLPRVRSTLEQKLPLKVLALGPPSVSGVGQGGGLAPYPVRLQHALANALPDVEVTVEARSLRGEVTAQATETIMNLTTEVEPELIVWQVGINDVLAKAEVSPFAEALDEVLRWARLHKIDAVLVEPPYTAALATDDHFAELITAIRDRVHVNQALLIRRSAAMRFLSGQRTEAAQSRFGLQNLGYHCTAEHVAHAVSLSLNALSGSR